MMLTAKETPYDHLASHHCSTLFDGGADHGGSNLDVDREECRAPLKSVQG